MQVRNEVKELRLLFEVLQILDSASDLSDNLETVLEVMAEHTGMMRGVITLLDEAHGEIAIEAAYGMSAEAQSKGRYKLGEGITGKVIESGKPLVIPNVLVEPLFLNRTGSRSRKEAVSFICVPVKMEGRVIGALSADRLFAASEALEEDMRLLSVLASLISKAVKNRQERHRMLEENRRLLDVLRERSRPEMFVGRSPGLRAVLTQLAQVAPTSATVLLLGESGTGKELAANTIHAGSPRAGHPFIKINCAALPEGLIESELFGHEKGAFTGAVGMRKGRFEAADGGTLFLDEIGELAVSTQVKLLRVLQEQARVLELQNQYEADGMSKARAGAAAREIAALEQNRNRAQAGREYRRQMALLKAQAEGNKAEERRLKMAERMKEIYDQQRGLGIDRKTAMRRARGMAGLEDMVERRKDRKEGSGPIADSLAQVGGGGRSMMGSMPQLTEARKQTNLLQQIVKNTGAGRRGTLKTVARLGY